MIIDFHTHTFPARISADVLAKLSRLSHTKYLILLLNEFCKRTVPENFRYFNRVFFTDRNAFG